LLKVVIIYLLLTLITITRGYSWSYRQASLPRKQRVRKNHG